MAMIETPSSILTHLNELESMLYTRAKLLVVSPRLLASFTGEGQSQNPAALGMPSENGYYLRWIPGNHDNGNYASIMTPIIPIDYLFPVADASRLESATEGIIDTPSVQEGRQRAVETACSMIQKCRCDGVLQTGQSGKTRTIMLFSHPDPSTTIIKAKRTDTGVVVASRKPFCPGTNFAQISFPGSLAVAAIRPQFTLLITPRNRVDLAALQQSDFFRRLNQTQLGLDPGA